MNLSGKLIVIEGIDGSGKSTFSKRLSAALAQKHPTSLFFEPGKESPASKEIENILTGKVAATEDTSKRLGRLFYEDRIWQLEKKIAPLLERGECVVLDRYYFSTAAYQSNDLDEVQKICEGYLDDPLILKPALVFWLKVSPEIALKRVVARKGEAHIFEKKEQLEKIAAHYSYMFETFFQNPQKKSFEVAALDAALTPDEIEALALKKIFETE